MSTTRLIVAAALLLFVMGLKSSCESAAQHATVANGDLIPLVEKRVREWQPTTEEHRFDEIGWVKSIRDAERLAAEHMRPVFLFTYDGRMMSTHRC